MSTGRFAPPVKVDLSWVEALGRVAVRGGELLYADNGVAASADRPTVVCLHGFPDLPRGFAPMLAAFRERGQRAVAPWLRGYAPSVTSGEVTLEALADDLEALLAQLSPAHPVVLIGHDWGAAITYAVAARSPARVAAAVAMAVPHPLAFLRHLKRPAQLRRSWYMAAFQLPGSHLAAMARDGALIDRLWAQWSPGYVLPTAYRDELHRVLRAGGKTPFAYYRAMTRPLGAAIGRLRATTGVSAAITVPTLYLHGASDGCIAPGSRAGAARHFRGPYEEQVLEGVGHFLQLEAPDAVFAVIDRWLGGLSRRSSRAFPSPP